ncbi:hypothetical protein FF38_13532 [Lucilia cuprina]|uniref:Protein TsetseEP domain-containing protein n=1 Tax=Lucilia cuprina TaxID=7375 RepID=A0A0L0BS81_LUCCU|nr:hypothetical protein CVS40_7928 [Lucilia cuprina]KNC22099.1 hypothetical protein FF38_13532 [Lucilia cuprina]
MLLKYILICCLLQQVLSAVKDCPFPEHHPEHQVANKLINDKKVCSDAYVQCITTSNQSCFETYNNCLKDVIEDFKEAAIDFDLLIKIVIETQNEVDIDCNSVCFYEIIFRKLLENHLFCG